MWRLISVKILVSLFALASFAPFSGGEDSKTLTDENYRSFLDENENVFVKFYLPYCHHCRALVDPWDELAELCSGHGSIKIAEMNCEDYKKICKSFGVNEYPYILLFKDGQKFQRFGNENSRTKVNMVAFIKKNLGIDVAAKDET